MYMVSHTELYRCYRCFEGAGLAAESVCRVDWVVDLLQTVGQLEQGQEVRV